MSSWTYLESTVLFWLLSCSFYDWTNAYDCTYTVQTEVTSYAEGVEGAPYTEHFDQGNAGIWLAFNLDQCRAYCCELESCVAGVFNNQRGYCYLKAVVESNEKLIQSPDDTYFVRSTRIGSKIIFTPKTCSTRKGLVGNEMVQVDFDALRQGVKWWYNWYSSPGSISYNNTNSEVEYVPMAWGEKSFSTNWPEPCNTGAQYLLGFNEPNFKSQSDLTVEEAISVWPQVMKWASDCNIPILVAPAVNHCPTNDCVSGTSKPVEYLKQFFKTYDLEHYAVHIYTGKNHNDPSDDCYVPYVHHQLFKYYTAFPRKKIWLTEISCDNARCQADQVEYISNLLDYLEAIPENILYRYSWFQAHEHSDSNLNRGKLIERRGSGKLSAAGCAYLKKYPLCDSSFVPENCGTTIPCISKAAHAHMFFRFNIILSILAYGNLW